MMRVALVLAGPYPAPRGSQLLVSQLAHGLRSRGHVVGVVSHGADAPALPSIGWRRLRDDLALARRLWRTVRRDRVDVLHAHNYEAAMVALLVGRLARVPVVFHGHAAFAEELPTYVGGRLRRRAARWLGTALDRHVPRRADHCLTVTPGLAARLQGHGVATAAIECLSPVAPPDLLPPLATTPTAGDEIVYAGNLDAYQKLDLLLDAFARVREQRPTVRLTLLTHPPQPATTAWCAPGMTVLEAADAAEMQRRLAAATIAVIPRTDPTGFPMKLQNYLAAGKAIVVSAGAAHGLRHDVDALVVPDGDPAAFAAAIVRLLADAPLRERLGRAARRLAEDPVSWNTSLDRVEAIYRRLLARNATAFVPVPQLE